MCSVLCFFFFNDTATTEIYTLSLHDALPIYYRQFEYEMALELGGGRTGYLPHMPKLKEGETEPYHIRPATEADLPFMVELDRKSARLNSSHANISYAVFCLKKKKNKTQHKIP